MQVAPQAVDVIGALRQLSPKSLTRLMLGESLKVPWRLGAAVKARPLKKRPVVMREQRMRRMHAKARR
jgi:hypothetical protein